MNVDSGRRDIYPVSRGRGLTLRVGLHPETGTGLPPVPAGFPGYPLFRVCRFPDPAGPASPDPAKTANPGPILSPITLFRIFETGLFLGFFGGVIGEISKWPRIAGFPGFPLGKTGLFIAVMAGIRGWERSSGCACIPAKGRPPASAAIRKGCSDGGLLFPDREVVHDSGAGITWFLLMTPHLGLQRETRGRGHLPVRPFRFSLDFSR